MAPESERAHVEHFYIDGTWAYGEDGEVRLSQDDSAWGTWL